MTVVLDVVVPHHFARLPKPATRAAGLKGFNPHELRHTAASLLIAAGADPKAVQEQLGHTSIKVTDDVYGHLFEQHLDLVLEALDAQGRTALATQMRPSRDPEAPDGALGLSG